MDERYDMMRAVRDERYKYIRNYMPHRIYGQHLNYLWKMPRRRGRGSERTARARCSAAQSVFWRQKPAEELYDVAGRSVRGPQPGRRRRFGKCWSACAKPTRPVRGIRDTGFVPEGELLDRAARPNPLRDGPRGGFPLEHIIETAELASARDPAAFPQLKERLEDEESCVRYWAATGCAVLGMRAERAAVWLIGLLEDGSGDVRIAAAEALCCMERCELAVPALVKELENPNPKVVLHCVNVLDTLGPKARPALDALKKLLEENKDNYIRRAAGHLTGVLEP